MAYNCEVGTKCNDVRLFEYENNQDGKFLIMCVSGNSDVALTRAEAIAAAKAILKWAGCDDKYIPISLDPDAPMTSELAYTYEDRADYNYRVHGLREEDV